MSTATTKHHIELLLIVFFILIFMSVSVIASNNKDRQQYEYQLEALQKKISTVQGKLSGTIKQRQGIVTELKFIEAKISKSSVKLKTIHKAIELNQRQKIKQEKALAGFNKKLSHQRQFLAKQIQSAHTMGHQQNLKLILNQQDPAMVGRTQQYYNYFNQARTKQIQHFLETIKQRQKIESELERTLQNQKSLLLTQKKKKKNQLNQRNKRKKIIKRMSKTIVSQKTTITSLEKNHKRIEQLLASLGELLADIPDNISGALSFKSQKGKLHWPVRGKAQNSFKQAKPQGGLKWNGLVLKTDFGTPVKVIAHGRVAFSDWLQGFGFITIINHGDGFMSLYGYNESLFKAVGEWVETGEVIATAGDSGGQQSSGVYFELRARGKPVDPTKWCVR